MPADVLFQPGSIGTLDLPNRLVRAGTSESMAGRDGEVTDQLIQLYEDLAANQVGLIITGHLYCDERGKYAVGQTGIHSDRLIEGLSRLTAAVHQQGGLIFAQIAHAGSQSRVPDNEPVAPSPVPNPLTGAEVAAAGPTDIEEAISAFGQGAGRAVAAGFDGVHVHGANGYLISEFTSPITNRRSDAWGGTAEARDQFSLSVLRAVRSAVPADYPVAMKIGFVDALPGGLDLEESVRRAGVLVDGGLDAIEVSCGLMQASTDSAAAYVAVDRARAVQDFLIHRIFSPPGSEAYFRPWADALRSAVETKIILVGGMRTTWMMRDVLASGSADFVAMARPLIREPDIVRRIAEGREGKVDCTSCNLCLLHEGHHSLRCWRTPRRRLLQHARYRLTGGFKRAPVVPTRH